MTKYKSSDSINPTPVNKFLKLNQVMLIHLPTIDTFGNFLENKICFLTIHSEHCKGNTIKKVIGLIQLSIKHIT